MLRKQHCGGVSHWPSVVDYQGVSVARSGFSVISGKVAENGF